MHIVAHIVYIETNVPSHPSIIPPVGRSFITRKTAHVTKPLAVAVRQDSMHIGPPKKQFMKG